MEGTTKSGGPFEKIWEKVQKQWDKFPPPWLDPGNIREFFTAGPDKSPLRAKVQDVISNEQDELKYAADVIVAMDEKLDVAIEAAVNAYKSTPVDEGVEGFIRFLDNRLEHQFGDQWEELRGTMQEKYHVGELYFKAATTAHSFLNHDGLEANWMPLYMDWLLELERPELGEWDIDPKTGYDRVTITNPDFIHDLIGHPGHQELVLQLEENFPDIGSIKAGFEETVQHVPYVVTEYYEPGVGSFEGKYAEHGADPYRITAINGFLGSFRETAKEVSINEDDHTITIDFEWWNKSGAQSAFRKSRDEVAIAAREGLDANKVRIDDYAREQYGLGGTFVQQFEGKVTFPYDPLTGAIDYAAGQQLLEQVPQKEHYDKPVLEDIADLLGNVSTTITQTIDEEIVRKFTDREEAPAKPVTVGK